jgi:transcriptional regulator of acetoin/glycerol metabolism
LLVHPTSSGLQPTPSTDVRQLVIVRRGQFATFGLLSKALTEEPEVRIIWDRRQQERRRRSDSNQAGDRRGPDRRRDGSTLWARHDYIVLGTTGSEQVASIAPPVLLQDPAAAAAALQAARNLDQDIEAAARTNINLLITGGDPMSRKSLAEQVHRRNTGSTNPLTIIDRRLASELFGGPEQASSSVELIGGVEPLSVVTGRRTWLIEEVGNLSWQQQTGLLRFLERRDHEASAPWAVPHPRLITATDDWLFDRVTTSQFHPDLFYRLNMIHIVLPAGVVGARV